jgi:hypothetical protein
MTVIKVYIIPTCLACAAYINTLRNFCCRHNLNLEIYDIDSDPIESIKYLREYKGCSTSIPFIGIYDAHGTRINCISGFYDEDALENIYERYR